MSAQLGQQFQHANVSPANNNPNGVHGVARDGFGVSKQYHQSYPYPFPHKQDPNAVVSVCPEISDIWDKPVVVLKPW